MYIWLHFVETFRRTFLPAMSSSLNTRPACSSMSFQCTLRLVAHCFARITFALSANELIVCRVTKFDNADAPDFSKLGHGRNQPHSSNYDAYSSRSEPHSNRDSYRDSSNADNGFSAVRERVQMGIATSHSHTEMLQDMVLSMSEGSTRRDAESDKDVLKDLVKEMVAFRWNPCNSTKHADTMSLFVSSA